MPSSVVKKVNVSLSNFGQNESFPIPSNNYKRSQPFSYNPDSRPLYTHCIFCIFGDSIILNSGIVLQPFG